MTYERRREGTAEVERSSAETRIIATGATALRVVATAAEGVECRTVAPVAGVQIGAPDALSPGHDAQCRDMASPAAVQIGAPGLPAPPACDAVAAAADRDRRAHAEVCDVEVVFTGPASVVALVRDVLDAFARPGAPRWTALEALLGRVIAYWERFPRHRDPIFARDGWRPDP